MLDRIEIFRMAHAMSQHAGTRQATIAQNIAQADTPGYRARDVIPFAETYQNQGGAESQRATRPGHLNGESTRPGAVVTIDQNPATQSPNGNTVSIETEMMRATEVRHQHDTALAIYQSSLNILRASLGRR